MNDDLKDILANSNKDIDNQQLMNYLTNELSKADTHDMEKEMVEDDFLNDAVEGLQKIESKKNMEAYVEQLNTSLQKQTEKNKKRKEKRRLKDDTYTYLTILIILILLVIGYVVIKKYIEAKPNTNSTTNRQLTKEM